jgi:hypothetical protein
VCTTCPTHVHCRKRSGVQLKDKVHAPRVVGVQGHGGAGGVIGLGLHGHPMMVAPSGGATRSHYGVAWH